VVLAAMAGMELRQALVAAASLTLVEVEAVLLAVEQQVLVAQVAVVLAPTLAL
jgi:hypothetical protein